MIIGFILVTPEEPCNQSHLWLLNLDFPNEKFRFLSLSLRQNCPRNWLKQSTLHRLVNGSQRDKRFLLPPNYIKRNKSNS